MTKLIAIAALSLTFLCCKTQYKKCIFHSNDESLQAYNDVLNWIIVEGSYNYYLGSDEETIFKRYSEHPEDSLQIRKDVIKLHNNLFGNNQKFCTVYLDTTVSEALHISPNKLRNDTTNFGLEVKALLQEFSNYDTVLPSLNSVQQSYKAEQFTACVANIKPIASSKTDKAKCFIGTVGFSKISFTPTKDKAVLYYELRCGGLCGYGNIILIEKTNNLWTVKKEIMTWIS
jgi:hypothetical protein